MTKSDSLIEEMCLYIIHIHIYMCVYVYIWYNDNYICIYISTYRHSCVDEYHLPRSVCVTAINQWFLKINEINS
jgi:hypothetical protein